MGDFEQRIKAAGMLSVKEMLERNALGKFSAHHGVRSIEDFERWLLMRGEEFIRLQARIELDKEQDGELYEWAIAHNAVFGEVLANFRQATKK